MARSKWIAQSYTPLPLEPKLRLICLPWAGGSSSVYGAWPGLLDMEEVEVVPVELPGRAGRSEEEPCSDVGALVAKLAEALVAEPGLLATPFALFGHSFGGLCAYELCRSLAAREPPVLPVLLLISAAPAPHFAGLGSWPADAISKLPQPELEAYLASKGNPLPREILADPELSRFFLRAIRADYGALEAYCGRQDAAPLPCPIQVYGGLGDIPEERLAAWAAYSCHKTNVRMHPGGHFYIQEPAQRAAVVAHIAEGWDNLGDPQSETVHLVAAATQSVLGLSTPPEGDLVQAGLSSLDAISLAAAIRGKTGVGLTPDQVIRRPFVHQLARYVDIRLSSGSRGPPDLAARSLSEVAWHPVSHQQEQMIVMYEVSKSAYNMPTTLDWEGPFSVEALRKALRALVLSQGTLRTVVKMGADGDMKQRVLEPERVEECYELREIAAGTEAEAAKAIESESVRVFDLEKGPTFRASVISGWSATRRYVLLNQHHLGADGWTRMLTRRQLCNAYVALASGKADAGLRPIPLSYLDFTYWQHEWLEDGGERARQLRYWRQQLASQQVLDLPLDKPRPQQLSEKGYRRSVIISPADCARVKACFDAAGCSAFQGFLALYMAMLSRWTSVDDITVGVAMAGRQHAPELADLVGYFANEVAVRCDFSGAPSLSDVLVRVKAAVMDGMANSAVPFHDVVNELKIQRDAARTPVFQAMFAYQERAWHTVNDVDFAAVGAKVDVKRFEHNTCKFEVHLQLRSDGAHGIEGDFYYHKDLFEEASGDRMVQHLHRLIQSAVTSPGLPLCSLEVAAADERESLVRRWNDTSPGDFPAPLRVEDHVFLAAAEHGSRAALVSDQSTMTYAELARNAAARAPHVQKMAGGPGSVVGLMMERSPELFVAILAILKASCAYLPVDGGKTPIERVKFMLDDGGATLMIADSCYKAVAEEATRRSVLWDDVPTTSASLVELRRNKAESMEDTFCIFYTSGTTGQPKGVLISHANCHNLIAWWRRFFSVEPSDKVLQFSSYSFVMSLRQIFPTLAAGAALVLPSIAEAFGEACEQHQVTKLVMTPSALETLEVIPSSIRAVQVAGEKPSLALAQKWANALEDKGGFFIGLGPTELAAHACCGRFRPDDRVTIGRPAENVRVYILHPAEGNWVRPVQPINVVGELIVAGANVAKGYLNRPDQNAKSFKKDVYAGHGQMYCTGDLAKRSADGRVQFIGRADMQIKLRGFRIEVSEVVAAIQKTPSIRKVEVQLRDGALVAYVVPELDDGAKAAMRAELDRWLPAYMIPGHIICLAEFPLNKNGKVDSAALPAPSGPSGNREGGQSAKPPRTQAERAIHTTWAEMLGLRHEDLSISDNFFARGGTSLLAVVMSRKVNGALGCRLSVADVFNNQTVEALAALADPNSQAEDGVQPQSKGITAEWLPPLVERPPTGEAMGPCYFLFLQVLGMLLVTTLASAPVLLVSFIASRVMLSQGIVTAALALTALIVLSACGCLLLILITKWVVLGRYRPGSYRLYSRAFLTWWLMRKVITLARSIIWIFDETPLTPMWYRLLGAKIGRGVTMENAEILEPDLVTIGDGARLQYHCCLLAAEVIGDGLQLSRVTIGPRASCGVRSVILGGACVGEGCQVGAKSHVFAPKMPPFTRVEGCPAIATGSVRPVERLTPRRTCLLGLLQALAGVLIIITMELAFISAASIVVVLWEKANPAVALAFAAIFTSVTCAFAWLMQIVILKWVFVGRIRPSDRPRCGTLFLASKWLIDRMLLSPAHHYAAVLILQNSSTSPIYFKLLGAKIGPKAWVHQFYVRTGIDTLTMGHNSHWSREGVVFTETVSAEGVTFQATTFGDHVSVGQMAVASPGVKLGSHVTVGAETSLREGLEVADGHTVFGCPPLMFKTSRSNAQVVAETQVAAKERLDACETTSEVSLQDIYGKASQEQTVVTDTGRMQDIGSGSNFYFYVCATLLLQTLGPFLIAVSFGGVWGVVNYVLVPEQHRNSVLIKLLTVPPVYFVGACLLIFLLFLLAKTGLTDFRSGSTGFFTVRFLCWHIFADVIYTCSSTVLYPFSGTAIYVVWLRLMGAKIGKRVFISPEQGGFREINFLEVGDNAVILTPNLRAHYTDHGMLQFAQVKVHKNVRLNMGAVVLPLTEYQEGCALRPYTVAVKGQKFERYRVYTGCPGIPMTASTAILLPGQGTQYASMLKNAAALPNVRAMLDEARALLGYNIADLDEAALARTENTHVAVLIADLAAVERLRLGDREAFARCTAVLGFSLGEIAALVVARALPFSAALQLAHMRGRAIAELCQPGAMCNVVGLRRADVERLCGETGCSVANVLVSFEAKPSDNILVCSGTAEAVEALTAAARAAGASKAERLAVSHAFHSAALKPAEEQYRTAVHAAPLVAPELTVYSNVTGRPYPANNVPEMRRLLVQQLCAPVEWHAALEGLSSGLRPGSVYECGPKRQLKAIMRRFDTELWKDTTCIEVGEPLGALQPFAEEESVVIPLTLVEEAGGSGAAAPAKRAVVSVSI